MSFSEDLLEAYERSDYDAVKRLREQGHWFDRNDESWTELHFAALLGWDDIVSGLVGQSQCDIAATSVGGSTPLHLACRGGHASTVRLLARLGADLEETDEDGDSPRC